MFFSRVFLNPARRDCVRFLTSPHRLHAAVLASFPPGNERGSAGRVLWRLDRFEQRRTELYVVSPERPDFSHLIEQAGWPTTQTWETSSYSGFLSQIRIGQQYVFRVTANPVKSVRFEPGARTKPISLIKEVDQVRWLEQRAATAGFSLVVRDDELMVRVENARRVSFPRTRSTEKVRLQIATFEGALEVRSAELLRHTLSHGIGRARGYGCGLLTLAPSRR